MKLIHVTDTHLVPPGQSLYGLDPCRRLEECIASINRHQADAALCVLTGDLAHHGDPLAYRAMRDCLSRLAIPWRLVIGNHDDRAMLYEAFPDHPRDPASFLQSVVDTEEGRLILLDSKASQGHGGMLCPTRLQWLAARLEESADNPVFLFLHHPPFPCGLPHIDRFLFVGADDLSRLLGRHGNIRHIFFGHAHRPIFASWHGIPCSTLRATAHQFVFSLTEQGVVGVEEPPSYGVVLIEKDTVIVHLHDFQEQRTYAIAPA